MTPPKGVCKNFTNSKMQVCLSSGSTHTTKLRPSFVSVILSEIYSFISPD